MEEQQARELWMAKAKECKTDEKLLKFIHELENQPWDYGKCVVAAGAAAMAAFWRMDSAPHGGFTGFQASCFMWEIVREINMTEGPKRLLSYRNMLYPQSESEFAKTISPSTWEYLQEQAKKELEDRQVHAAQPVADHWQSIVDGQVPFGFTVADED